MCINDSWRQALIICSTLWWSGLVPLWITCSLVKHFNRYLHGRVLGQLINAERWGGGRDMSLDSGSVNLELIISQHTAHSLHRGCRGTQVAKSNPCCAYSPHLRSLCCAVHSGPPVQLFLYKKLQNSILQSENRDKQWEGVGDKNNIKTQRTETVNVTPWLLQNRDSKGCKYILHTSHARNMWQDILSTNR